MKDVISYTDLAQKEGFQIQKGMNYKPMDKNYSILLMSVSEDSPYNDGFDEKGEHLLYEGEDVNRRENPEPKTVDQPLFTKNGKLTNNGHFFKAAEEYKTGRKKRADRVKVYEKIKANVWSDKGLFDLIDVTFSKSDHEDRKVFKFILRPIALTDIDNKDLLDDLEFSRRIPTAVKRLVFERDGGKCVDCGSTENLHFDHILPFSKGGSSTDPKNVQILCGKHNLSKSDKII